MGEDGSVNPDWRVVESENRALSVLSARPLGEGWNSHAYLVNEEVVFRFPKRADVWEGLDREIRFLTFVTGKLSLRTPRYVMVAPGSRAADHGYAAYVYLRGHALDVKTLDSDRRIAAADAIAKFLRGMHRLDLGAEGSDLIPREDARLVAEEYLARAERELSPRLAFGEVRALRCAFEGYLSDPDNFTFRPVVLHADLSADHLVAEYDAVMGVLDFGDVSWGDPDYDFVYLLLDYGAAFVEEVTHAYEHPDPSRLLSKLNYFALVDQIGTILDGPGRAREGQVHAAWQRLKDLLHGREQGA